MRFRYRFTVFDLTRYTFITGLHGFIGINPMFIGVQVGKYYGGGGGGGGAGGETGGETGRGRRGGGTAISCPKSHPKIFRGGGSAFGQIFNNILLLGRSHGSFKYFLVRANPMTHALTDVLPSQLRGAFTLINI